MRIATTPIALSLVGILNGPRSIADPGTVRARDLGVPFDGTPGELNAITDVAGVEVGYSTIIKGKGALEVGKGPVRTGVNAMVAAKTMTGINDTHVVALPHDEMRNALK